MNNFEFKEGNPKTITLISPQSSRFSRIILQVFSWIFFALPVFSTVLAVILIGEVSPAIVIFYIIFGLCGYFFLKLFLWNKYGKEIISLNNSQITYEADYKLFRANKVVLNTKNLKIKINPIGTDKGTFIFESEEGKIETVVKTSLANTNMLKEKLESIYS
jgi:uncharacterized membrane protein YuzA (DUF378 family)